MIHGKYFWNLIVWNYWHSRLDCTLEDLNKLYVFYVYHQKYIYKKIIKTIVTEISYLGWGYRYLSSQLYPDYLGGKPNWPIKPCVWKHSRLWWIMKRTRINGVSLVSRSQHFKITWSQKEHWSLCFYVDWKYNCKITAITEQNLSNPRSSAPHSHPPWNLI